MTEKSLVEFLERLDEGFGPVRLTVVEKQYAREIDALVEARWNERRWTFAVEAKTQFNPKAIQGAMDQASKLAEQIGVAPMILVPYLSEKQLGVLESRQISGIDMCGNGVIIVPDQMLVYRTGNPNEYPSSAPIRNVYRGTSSIVARTFVIRPQYESSQQLLEEIQSRGGEVTLSTVSKVCSSLEEDLVIERVREGRTTRLRLLQLDKLLDSLSSNYQFPEITRRFAGKIALDDDRFDQILRLYQSETSERIIRTGTTSCARYASMAREPIARYYCTDISGLVKRLGESVRETDRFPDVQFLETEDPAAYFDPRDEFDASPIQTLLELESGDKRERETAEQIRQKLLKTLLEGAEN